MEALAEGDSCPTAREGGYFSNVAGYPIHVADIAPTQPLTVALVQSSGRVHQCRARAPAQLAPGLRPGDPASLHVFEEPAREIPGVEVV